MILETVLARNIPSSDVMCAVELSSTYVIFADSLPMESAVMSDFLWAVKDEDCTSFNDFPRRLFIIGTVESPDICIENERSSWLV